MRRKSEQEWDRIVAELGRSGLSQVGFAERHGLSVATLRYQLAKRRDVAPSSPPGFVEVRTSVASPSALSTSMVELNLGEHVRIRALEWPDVEWLADLARSVSLR